jgi:hypothetical protein
MIDNLQSPAAPAMQGAADKPREPQAQAAHDCLGLNVTDQQQRTFSIQQQQHSSAPGEATSTAGNSTANERLPIMLPPPGWVFVPAELVHQHQQRLAASAQLQQSQLAPRPMNAPHCLQLMQQQQQIWPQTAPVQRPQPMQLLMRGTAGMPPQTDTQQQLLAQPQPVLLPANGPQGMQQQQQLPLQPTQVLMAQPQLLTANRSQGLVLQQQQQAANTMLRQQQQAASCSSRQLQPPARPAAGSSTVQLAAPPTAAEPWGTSSTGIAMPGMLSRSISSASSDAGCYAPHAAGSADPAALPIAVPALPLSTQATCSGEAPFVLSQQQLAALQQHQQEQQATMLAQQQVIALQQQQLQDMMLSQQRMAAPQQQHQQQQAMLLSQQQLAPLAPPPQLTPLPAPQQQLGPLPQQQLTPLLQLTPLQQQQLIILQQQQQHMTSQLQQQLGPQLLAAPLQPQPGALCSASGAALLQLPGQGVVGQHLPAGAVESDVQYEPAAWQQQQLQQSAVAAGPACQPNGQQWQPTADPPVQVPHPRVASACLALSRMPDGTFFPV